MLVFGREPQPVEVEDGGVGEHGAQAAFELSTVVEVGQSVAEVGEGGEPVRQDGKSAVAYGAAGGSGIQGQQPVCGSFQPVGGNTAAAALGSDS